MKTQLLLLLLFPSFLLFAQPNPLYRSADGRPGAAYWQNRADYDLRVELDTILHEITGTALITYTNNSPQTLPYLWLHLDQNAFKATSRATAVTEVEEARHQSAGGTGIDIYDLQVEGDAARLDAFLVEDTRLQVRLNQPLAAQGGKITLRISYHFRVPEYGADRTGRTRENGAWIYEVAQWYPRMAVYDDLRGWNVEPYLGAGEFFCEFGSFDYRITLPREYIVVGSGVLQNSPEVLPQRLQQRLDRARKSAETVFVIPPDEAGKVAQTRPAGKEKLTWHFRMENTRDVAWACSRAFIWDAAEATMPSGRKVTAMSVYPPSCAGEGAFGRSTEYLQGSLEFYSRMWYEYPFAEMVSVAGGVGGIEYPGLTFVPTARRGEALWRTTDHEVAHCWFPMVVGTNERRDGWIDEGLATFMGYYAAQYFNEGEYSSYISDYPAMLERLVNSPMRNSSTYPDHYHGAGYYDAYYFKPAVGMVLLREYILGPQRFDYAFQTFIREWAYRHPQPGDLFACFNNAAGEDLSWFWMSWFYYTDWVDFAVSSVEEIEKDGQLQWRIKLKDHGNMRLPLEVRFLYEDAEPETIRLPVEVWLKTREWTFDHAPKGTLKGIELDPDRWLPDTKRQNNSWSNQ